MLISSFRLAHLEAKTNRVNRFLKIKSSYQMNKTKKITDLRNLNIATHILTTAQRRFYFSFA